MVDHLSSATALIPDTGATWEYSVVSIHARNNDALEDSLNSHGREGWELVTVHIPVPYEYQLMFKRVRGFMGRS